MGALMLDGNAVAGVLQEVFAADVTTAIGTCSTCGVSEPLGAVHVFRGAGDVLRCPHCDNTLMKIVRGGDRLWISFSGIRTISLNRGSASTSSVDASSDAVPVPMIVGRLSRADTRP